MAHTLPEEDLGCFRSRESFAVDMLLKLTEVLESAVGQEEADGFVNFVVHRVGQELNAELVRKRGGERLDAESMASVLVQLKRNIGGDFRVVECTPARIVLHNTRCPFGTAVRGRDCLCMMTSGLFGRIAADNLGYARVAIPESIAKGASHCHVVIHLTDPDPDSDAIAEEREYFGS